MSDDVDVGACAPPGLVAVRLPNRVAQQRMRREAGLKAGFADVFRGVFLPVDDALPARLWTELLLRVGRRRGGAAAGRWSGWATSGRCWAGCPAAWSSRPWRRSGG